MSQETPVAGTAAARRRRLRPRGQIARKPPPTQDERPKVWPKRMAILAVLAGVGVAGWSLRARLASLWGSAVTGVTTLVRSLGADPPVEFTDDLEIDVPDEFIDVPSPSRPPSDWTDPSSIPPELAPLPDPTPRPERPPATPTQVASATPVTPGPPEVPEDPAEPGPGLKARAGDLWTRAKRGWKGLVAKLEWAEQKLAKLMGEEAPTPAPSPSLPPIDPNYDPFEVGSGSTPKPTATPSPTPTSEPTQVAVVDPLAVVHGPDWVPPVDPTPIATRDPWDQTPPPTPTRPLTPVPRPEGSPWAAQLAGAAGQRMSLASGVRLDLHPYTRYRQIDEELVLLSGGALVRFPARGGSLRLSGGLRLRGQDQLFEVSGVESGGSVDALTAGLVMEQPERPSMTMRSMERRYFDEDLAEPVPLAEAATFVRRLAWFDAHPRRARAAARALELAQEVLEETRGTSREAAAREAVTAAIAWAERVAMRRQREVTARL